MAITPNDIIKLTYFKTFQVNFLSIKGNVLPLKWHCELYTVYTYKIKYYAFDLKISVI